MADKLLIVDDDPMLREMMSTFLSGKGYVIQTSADGWDAVREIVVNKPDLVVMDVNMPKMSGLNALDVLRVTRLTEHIPVIICSAEGDRDTILKAVQLGADDFVVKPFSLEHLATRIAAQLLRLDFSVVHGLLVELQTPRQPVAPPSWPGMDPLKYKDWNAYTTFLGERELCLLFRHGLTLVEAMALDEAEAAKAIVVLARTRALWKCVWPRPR